MVTLESAAGRSCLINLDAKQTGKPIAGNRRDRFEVAETGNRLTVRILRHSRRKREAPARLNLRSTAPLFDPTTTLSILAAFVCRCRSPYDWRGLLTAASVRNSDFFCVCGGREVPLDMRCRLCALFTLQTRPSTALCQGWLGSGLSLAWRGSPSRFCE